MADAHHEHPPEDPTVCERGGIFFIAVLAVIILLAYYN